MADQARPSQDGSPSRRPRAPTITIETAVPPSPSPQDGQAAPDRPASTQDDPVSPSTTAVDPMASSWSGSSRRPEEQPGAPFDSRPQSPHNISSPISSRPEAFLSVPGNLRTRQDSLDSDNGSPSLVSSQEETVTPATRRRPSGPRSAPVGDRIPTAYEIMNDGNALKPDKGKEADFQVTDNPFAFSPGQMSKFFNPKSLAAFWKVGGLSGLERGLRTDRTAGLSIDEKHLPGQVTFDAATNFPEKLVEEGVSPARVTSTTHAHGAHHHSHEDEPFFDRKRVFSDNRLPEKKGKTLLQLMWITYNDKVLILLSVAAVVSLAIGLYQTFRARDPDEEHEPKVEWVEGVAIIAAIVIVVVVGSLNDYQKERQFAKLNKKKQDRNVKAVRSGKAQEISVYDVLVGDVLHLEPGDMIPVDGVLIEGYNIKCDESQATGESDAIHKKPADTVYDAIKNGQSLKKMDPFIQSGATVMEGVGTFLVTSTGIHSSYGATLMGMNEDPEMTPLQSKLNVIAEYIAKLGSAAGLLLFVVLFIQFLAHLPGMDPDVTAAEKGQIFLNIFIVVVTIIVVAVPEGLPLAVTVALAFATTRMLKDNNLVRQLKACEIMGNATAVCSDKTGTLTQNKMQVVAGTVSTSHRFGKKGEEQPPSDGSESPSSDLQGELSANELSPLLCPEVKKLLLESIVLNSTAFEGEVEGTNTFIGSKTETALLIFAKEHLGMGPVAEERANANIVQLFPFDSGRKCMGVAVKLPNGKTRVFVKGASEILLAKCTKIVGDPAKELSETPLTDDNRITLENLIEEYATRSLRTIAIVYRDFDSWPPRGVRRGDSGEVVFEDIFRHMAFLGLVGIQDPLRPGVPEAVATCQRAGVTIRMVTGDNRITAEAIAKECGIFKVGSLVMEGPEFRNLSRRQQDEIIPRLAVLARSSPEDKRILVARLKAKGEVVAVTGDGTNDAPALVKADVGFSMGIAGTEVAKEASSIILMDDNFISIVKALKWGRAVNDAVKKFLQFQLTVNITAVVLTFITAVASPEGESVLTAVQLLWVNLIMDTLAALALATDPPQDSVLNRLPEKRNASIISTTMWKMILGQAVYQLVITLVLNFGAESILGYDTPEQAEQLKTLVFNTFVWMQIFNQWNSRRLDNNFNICEGLSQNWFFISINFLKCAAQVLIVLFGGEPFKIAKDGQDGAQWGIALVLGFMSVPIGMIIRLIPDRLIEKLVPDYLKRRKAVPDFNFDDEDGMWVDSHPFPLTEVRDDLVFLRKFKGGRISNLRFAISHPREYISKSPSHSRSNSINVPPQTPTREDSYGSVAPTPDSRKRSRSMRSRSNSALGAPTVMAGIIAAGVAAGWSPVDRNSEFPPRMSVQQSSSGLSEMTPRGAIPEGGDLAEEEPSTVPQNGSDKTDTSERRT